MFTLIQPVVLHYSQFLMPGLVDTHIHAPQYCNTGTGYELKLLGWLDKYTRPTEAKFTDLEFARNVYSKVVVKLCRASCTRLFIFCICYRNALFGMVQQQLVTLLPFTWNQLRSSVGLLVCHHSMFTAFGI